jgi:hypothetical protein
MMHQRALDGWAARGVLAALVLLDGRLCGQHRV